MFDILLIPADRIANFTNAPWPGAGPDRQLMVLVSRVVKILSSNDTVTKHFCQNENSSSSIVTLTKMPNTICKMTIMPEVWVSRVIKILIQLY